MSLAEMIVCVCSASFSRIKQDSALLPCLMGYSHNERSSQTQGCVNVAGISLFEFSAGQRKSMMPVVFADVTCSLDCFQTDQQKLSLQENKCTSKCLCESHGMWNRSHRLWHTVRIKWYWMPLCFIDILYGDSTFIHHYTSYWGEDTGWSFK